MRQSGTCRDIGERAVAVVVKEIARRFTVLYLRIEAAAIHEEDIEPAVAVVVEERRTASHLLEQIPLVLSIAGDVDGLEEPGRRRDVREQHAIAAVLSQQWREIESGRRTGGGACSREPEEPAPGGDAVTARHAVVREGEVRLRHLRRGGACRARPTRARAA